MMCDCKACQAQRVIDDLKRRNVWPYNRLVKEWDKDGNKVINRYGEYVTVQWPDPELRR